MENTCQTVHQDYYRVLTSLSISNISSRPRFRFTPLTSSGDLFSNTALNSNTLPYLHFIKTILFAIFFNVLSSKLCSYHFWVRIIKIIYTTCFSFSFKNFSTLFNTFSNSINNSSFNEKTHPEDWHYSLNNLVVLLKPMFNI